MTRYVEDLDLAKERAMVLQDELRNRIAEQQGMRMYVLSLVTAIFLPLSFLTGVFGMNVAGLPGTEEPKSFAYLATAMVILAIILLISMLWKKWF
jgi:zinc transporter